MMRVVAVISFPHQPSGRACKQVIEQVIGSLSAVFPIIGALASGLARLAPYIELCYPDFPIPRRVLVHQRANGGGIGATLGIAVHPEVSDFRHDYGIVHD